MTTDLLSPCGEIVRLGDPDRFRTALFAPPEKREHLFALYAFNLELAKIAPMVSEPMLGEIRLQWWREVIETAYSEGPVRAHEVVEPLTRAIRERSLLKRSFELLIDARASDLDPAFPADFEALKTYLTDTGGSLAVLAATALSGVADKEIEVVTDVGTAIATARYIQAMPILMAQGKRTIAYIPHKFEGLENRESTGSVRTQSDPNLSNAIRALASYGLGRLTAARAHRGLVSRANTPALLEARLADKALRYHSQRPMMWREAPRSTFSLFWGAMRGRW